ncbi:MAG TPA: LysM peptidoglycan-binding domain-containing protein [Propionicimonas sp.]|jgi:nucleoid-associated protein YgaU
MTHTPRAARAATDLVRGLAATLALVTFAAGVPLALVALAPTYLPHPLPDWSGLWARVVSPDDGTLLLAVLAAVAWITWAAFTTTVLVELIAAARRLRAPSLPLLGGFQRTASRLLATAGLLLATSSAITAPAAPAAASALVTPLDHQDAPHLTPAPGATQATTGQEPATAAPAPRTAALPTVTVQRGDTLWDIAERHLRDPLRYTEIRDLNLDRTQPDGRQLRDADWIQPGWTLLLPADAIDVEPAIATATAAPADEATVVVRPGDTLWAIAAARLGDGDRFPEIADLNHGITQADGARLTDPALIRPGWVLRLPTQMTTANDEAAAAAAASDAAASRATPLAVASPPHPSTAFPKDAAPAPAAPEPAPFPETASQSGPSAAVADDDADSARPASEWFLGFAALGAVGIVGEIARRRHLQQRARKIGETIPLPEVTSPAAAAERTLRAAAPPLSIEAIRTTLANVGCRCFDSGHELPRVGALLLNERHLTLLLVEESPDGAAPFTATNPRTWVATTADVAAEQPIDDPDQCIPYPLLVVLGHTDDATLIVNLEAAGTLAIVGDDDAAEDALRALVMEAATSDLASQLAIHVDEPLADLEGAFEDFRLRAIDERDDRAGTEATIAGILDSAGHDDTLQARSHRELDDLWLPVAFVEHALEAKPSAPWSGVVTLTRELAEGGWTARIAADGSALLEPLALDYQPQRLSDEHMERLRSALMLALPPESRRTPQELATTVSEDVETLRAARPPIEPARPTEPAVTINVLGPIEIRGLPSAKKSLSPLQEELLVYLALHGPATGSDLDEALWNGQRVDPQTRASLIYRTRQRAGEEVLPVAGRWRPLLLGDGVRTDWHQFQQLVADALTRAGDERVGDLTKALDLVRDRPFRGIEGTAYAWADYDIQRIASAIADAALILARLQTESGQPRRAVNAAMRGLAVEPFSESLQQLALAATEESAGPDEAQRLRRRFAAAMSRLDPELA